MKSALQALIDLEQDSRKFGFEWPDTQMVIDQAVSESLEVALAINDGESRLRVQEEIGDLLHTAISLCLFEGFDVDETLLLIVDKFGKRMDKVKEITRSRGLENLRGQEVPLLLEIWKEAKK